MMRIGSTSVNTLLVGIILIVPGFTLSVSAQDGRLSLNHLNRFYTDAVESFDVRLDAEVLRVLSSSRQSRDRKEAEFNSALGGLKAVYAKGFRFSGPGNFDEADLAELRSQLSLPGWKQVLTIRKKGMNNLEMFLVPDNDRARALAILSVNPTEIYVVNLVGEIDIKQFSPEEGIRGLASLDQNWDRWFSRRSRDRSR